jgi:hypothetical protein
MIASKTITAFLFLLGISTYNPQHSEKMTLHDIHINNLDESPINLSDYKGKYILFVMSLLNVALQGNMKVCNVSMISTARILWSLECLAISLGNKNQGL